MFHQYSLYLLQCQAHQIIVSKKGLLDMEKLLSALKEREISKLQLALAVGISPSTLYSAINGKVPFYPKYKRTISKYLGIDEAVLFSERGGDDHKA